MDNQQAASDAFTRDDLKRSERFGVAVTVVWLTVAVLAIVLILALMPY